MFAKIAVGRVRHIVGPAALIGTSDINYSTRCAPHGGHEQQGIRQAENAAAARCERERATDVTVKTGLRPSRRTVPSLRSAMGLAEIGRFCFRTVDWQGWQSETEVIVPVVFSAVPRPCDRSLSAWLAALADQDGVLCRAAAGACPSVRGGQALRGAFDVFVVRKLVFQGTKSWRAPSPAAASGWSITTS